MATNR